MDHLLTSLEVPQEDLYYESIYHRRRQGGVASPVHMWKYSIQIKKNIIEANIQFNTFSTKRKTAKDYRALEANTIEVLPLKYILKISRRIFKISRNLPLEYNPSAPSLGRSST